MLTASFLRVSNGATLVSERNMYKASKIIKTIQYLLFQNVIRDWNDRLIQQYEAHSENFFEEINKIHIDEKILLEKR